MTSICKNCSFFSPRHDERGLCKRHAPRVIPEVHVMTLKLLGDIHWKLFGGEDTHFSENMGFESNEPFYPNWPMVENVDCCGEFKPMEQNRQFEQQAVQ